MSLSNFLALLRIAYQQAGTQAIKAIKKLIKKAKVVLDNFSVAYHSAIHAVLEAYEALTPGQKIAVDIILVLLGVGVAIGLIIAIVKVFGPMAAITSFVYFARWFYQRYSQSSGAGEDEEFEVLLAQEVELN